MFSDSEESSLTSISDFEPSSADSSEDESYAAPAVSRRKSTVNSTSTPGRKSAGTRKEKEKRPDYVITNALRPPRTTQYTAKSLYDQIVENSIDLDPEYQRDVVWTETKQSGLIDSILRHYYIPPIIFAVIAQDDGTEQRVCIDGKQRLTSIQRFMDGLIPHKDSFTNEKLYFKQTPGCKTKRRLLPKAYINRFGNEQICCVEYDGLTPDQEREIFQRVQLGVALTPAERMQALNGTFSSYLRDLQHSVLGPAPSGFGNTLEWSSERGRAFQGILTMVYFIEQYPTSSRFPYTDTLTKYLAKEGLEKDLEIKIRNMFDVYIKLAAESRYNSVFSRPSRLSPVEFVMFGVLIFAWMEVKLPRVKKDKEGQWMDLVDLKALSDALKDMRKNVRAKHADVRANFKVTKTMQEFIKKTIKDLSSTTNNGSSEAKEGKKKKRKRADSDDEMDGPPLSQAMGKTIAKVAKATGKASRATSGKPSTSSMAALPKISKKTPDGASSAIAVAVKQSKKSASVISAPPTTAHKPVKVAKKAKRSGGTEDVLQTNASKTRREPAEQMTARESSDITVCRVSSVSKAQAKPPESTPAPLTEDAKPSASGEQIPSRFRNQLLTPKQGNTLPGDALPKETIQRQGSIVSSAEVPLYSPRMSSFSLPTQVKPETISPQVASTSPTIPAAPPSKVLPSPNISASPSMGIPSITDSPGTLVKKEQDGSPMIRGTGGGSGSFTSLVKPGSSGLLDRLAPIRRARGATDPPTEGSRSATPSGAVADNRLIPTAAQPTRDPRRPHLPALQIDASQLHSLSQKRLQQAAPVDQISLAVSTGVSGKDIKEADIENLLIAHGIKLDPAQVATLINSAVPQQYAPQVMPSPSSASGSMVVTPSQLISNTAIASLSPSPFPPNVNSSAPVQQHLTAESWSIPQRSIPALTIYNVNGHTPPRRSPPREPRANRSISDRVYSRSTSSHLETQSTQPPPSSGASYDDNRDRLGERRRSSWDERYDRSRHDPDYDYDHDYRRDWDRGRERPRDKYRYRSRSRDRDRGGRYERKRDYRYDHRESEKSWSNRRRSRSPTDKNSA